MRGVSAMMILGLALGLDTQSRAEICGSNGSPVVYVTGSSAASPFLAALGRVLYADAHPLTIVYKSVGSCVGVSAVLNGDPISGDAVYWNPASPAADKQVTCTIPTGTVTTDLGISDVFASTCVDLPSGLPMAVGDFFGPVQTMTFIVPKASTQRSISAAAAYFVFGFGSQSGVAPWTEGAYIFRRSQSSGTQNLIAHAIGVPATRFQGQDALSSSGVINQVISSTQPEQTIGIIAATDVDDASTLSLNVLAYQHFGQQCGFLPDSEPGARDKKNVRDGHYFIWGPLHFLSKIDHNGYANNPHAQRLLNYVTGTQVPPGGVDLIQVEAISNLVPQCAMRVQRNFDTGPLSNFSPAEPCGCYFEQVSTGRSLCATCTQDADCPSTTPICSYGLCEPL